MEYYLVTFTLFLIDCYGLNPIFAGVFVGFMCFFFSVLSILVLVDIVRHVEKKAIYLFKS